MTRTDGSADHQRDAEKLRLIAKVREGDWDAQRSLGTLVNADADSAELFSATRSAAMTALIEAEACNQLESYVFRMEEVLAHQPDLLAELGDFAAMYTTLNPDEIWDRAAARGSTRALRYLSSWYSELDEPDHAIACMEAATRAGDEEAPVVLVALLEEQGRDEEAALWRERAAVGGWPQALNVRLWELLLTGEHQRAVDLFDRARQACERRATEGPEFEEHWSATYQRSWLHRSWLCCRSQEALHRLALGGSAETALAVWESEQQRRDLGSRIHTAILRQRLASPSATDLATQLGRKERRLIQAMLSKGLDSRGWFRNWSRDGLNLLASTTPASASVAEGAKDSADEVGAHLGETLRAVARPGERFPWFSSDAGEDYPVFRENVEIAAERGEMDAIVSLAGLLAAEGWEEESVDWHERAAVAGWPNSLGTVTWYHLLRGDHRAGIEAFDRARPACEARVMASLGESSGDASAVAEQWLNARSNDALNRLALGGPPEDALAVWAEGAEIGHGESLVCPAILAMRDGRDRDSYLAILRLSRKQRAAARTALAQGVDAKGWFADWCRDGVAMLDSCPPTPRGSKVTVVLTAEEAVVLRSLIHSRFDGLYCGPRGLLEEIDLKLAARSVPTATMSGLQAYFWDDDRTELRCLELPEALERPLSVICADAAQDVPLTLTKHEAGALRSLALGCVCLAGLGATLSPVGEKLAISDVRRGITFQLNRSSRLEVAWA